LLVTLTTVQGAIASSPVTVSKIDYWGKIILRRLAATYSFETS
jgi:hypothetical protein